MLVVVSLYAILFLPDVLDQLRGEVIAALLYVENWFLIFRNLSYFESVGRPPLLQHLWSLAVEEQFYLLWPLILVLVLTVWGKSRRALLVGVLVGVVRVDARDGGPLRTRTPTRRASTTAPTRAWPRCSSAPRSRSCGRRGDWRAGPAATRRCSSTWSRWSSGFVLCWMFLNVGEFDPSLYRGGFLVVALVSAVLDRGDGAPGVAVAAAAARPRRVPLDRGALVRHLPVALARSTWSRARTPTSRSPGIPLLVLRLALTLGAAAAVVPLRRGADPPRRARAVVGPVPHLVGGDPTQARGPLRARRGWHHPGPGGDRRRPRRRRERGRPGRVRQPDLGDHPAGQTTTSTAVPGVTTPTTVPATTAPPVTTRAADDGHRHRRLGDARCRQPAGGHRQRHVREPAGHRRRRRGEPAVLGRRRPDRAAARTRASSGRTSSCSSAPTAPSTRATSTA